MEHHARDDDDYVDADAITDADAPEGAGEDDADADADVGPKASAEASANAIIRVDVRERALLSSLAALGAPVQPVQLLLGDVEIVAAGEARKLVMERKTLADLSASIKDGRYREQKARLLANEGAANVMYVIETGHGGGFAFDGRLRGVGGMPATTLQGSVVSLLVDAGVRVVFTRDVDDTAALVRRLAERLGRAPSSSSSSSSPSTAPSCHYAKAACESAAVSAKKSGNLDPVACFRHMICQLPGVSATLAGTVCEEFGSMAGLYARLAPMDAAGRVKALSALPLIGKKKAAVLERFLFLGDA